MPPKRAKREREEDNEQPGASAASGTKSRRGRRCLLARGEGGVDSPIDLLEQKLKEKDMEQFSQYLVQSLTMAKTAAQTGLVEPTFNALSWPTTIPDYLQFLREFARYIPKQSSDPAWTAPADGHPVVAEQQEVYDRLCHFYFLIDQPVVPGEDKIIQDVPWFADWLDTYADYWGTFLDTPESFSQKELESFMQNSPKYEIQLSLMPDGKPNNPSGWLTFNQFFARELNPGLPIHHITAPGDNTVAVSPADSTYKNHFAINNTSVIEPPITIKGTHTFASVPQLLDGSTYATAFAGGAFYHAFLAPYSYHRFHAPVSGTVVECRAVAGQVYLDVGLDPATRTFSAPDSSKDGYEFVQARGIIIIDTSLSPDGDVGLVAVVPIGMCQVSSVNMIATKGGYLQKGDEFGYFLFGGSDIIVLYQQQAQAKISTSLTYHRYGNSQIATLTSSPTD